MFVKYMHIKNEIILKKENGKKCCFRYKDNFSIELLILTLTSLHPAEREHQALIIARKITHMTIYVFKMLIPLDGCLMTDNIFLLKTMFISYTLDNQTSHIE